MQFTTVTAILSGLTMVLAQTPDKPLTFFASLYDTAADCTGPAKAYVGSRGPCVNIPTLPGGSAKIVVGTEGQDFLAGWTGPDCTGTVLVIASTPGLCQDIGDVKVLSWSNDKKPFGGA